VKLEYTGSEFIKTEQANEEPHVVVARKSIVPLQQVLKSPEYFFFTLVSNTFLKRILGEN